MVVAKRISFKERDVLWHAIAHRFPIMWKRALTVTAYHMPHNDKIVFNITYLSTIGDRKEFKLETDLSGIDLETDLSGIDTEKLADEATAHILLLGEPIG